MKKFFLLIAYILLNQNLCHSIESEDERSLSPLSPCSRLFEDPDSAFKVRTSIELGPLGSIASSTPAQRVLEIDGEDFSDSEDSYHHSSDDLSSSAKGTPSPWVPRAYEVFSSSEDESPHAFLGQGRIFYKRMKAYKEGLYASIWGKYQTLSQIHTLDRRSFLGHPLALLQTVFLYCAIGGYACEDIAKDIQKPLSTIVSINKALDEAGLLPSPSENRRPLPRKTWKGLVPLQAKSDTRKRSLSRHFASSGRNLRLKAQKEKI